MDTLLCDELIQEIFHRLPPPSSAAISLVSKRFLHLRRISTTSLSLHSPPPSLLTTFLTNHPFLSSLSISTVDNNNPHLISAVYSCPNLRHLRFSNPPLPTFSLYSLSSSCPHLSSLSISLSRPLLFTWVSLFTSLKSLSLYFTNPSESDGNGEVNVVNGAVNDVELGLERLSLSGIMPGDYGVGFLFRNCKKVKNLELKSCESLGDYSSFSGFVKCLDELKVVELRTCRSVVDLVLLKLGESCVTLDTLLVYDGGSREGLLRFIGSSKCDLRKLDLRLPLDLDNTCLLGLVENLSFRSLVSLRLQSCCLVSGEGLKTVARALGGLEEVALINCDVVEREGGLLTSLGQSLKGLRKLDLSYNDVLVDKELMSMLVSCSLLSELKLRGCSKLSDAAVGSIVRSCKQLQSVDLTYCCGVNVEGVEFLVLNATWLKRVEVEESKLSEAAKKCAVNKFIEVVS